MDNLTKIASSIEKLAFGSSVTGRNKDGSLSHSVSQTSTMDKSPGRGFKLNKDLGPDRRGLYVWTKSSPIKNGTPEHTKAIEAQRSFDKMRKEKNREKAIKRGVIALGTGAGLGIAAVAGKSAFGKIRKAINNG